MKINLPFPPDSPKRRLISKKQSYVDLYDMNYEDDSVLGAIVPTLDDNTDDSSSIV